MLICVHILLKVMPIFSRVYIKEKWEHAGFQKYLRNTSWIFFGKIASMAISFLATAYIARSLGPTNYGQLSYAISYVGLFGFIATLGIDQILYRDLIKYPEKRNEYMGTALTLRIAASIVTVIICTLSALFLSTKDVSMFLIFLISSTFVFNAFQLLNYEFQAEAKAKYPTSVSLIVVLILNILKIVVVFEGNGVIYLAGIILLEPILYAIGFIYFRIKVYGSIAYWKFDKEIAVSMLKDSFPLIFASAFVGIYARIDQVMIKNMIDTASVGLYDSAVRISELWFFLPNIIVGALFPAIMNARKTSEQLYYARIRKLFFALMAVAILTALPTALLSKYLILIIFGPKFLGALGVLKIYVWSNIGAALTLLMQHLLIAENHSKIILFTAFFGMAINVGLNIFLIPAYGMSGAAIASLISYFIPFLSLVLFKDSRIILFKAVKL